MSGGYSIGEVAKKFEVHHARLRDWCNHGLIDSYRGARNARFIHESEFKKIEQIKQFMERDPKPTLDEVREELFKETLLVQKKASDRQDEMSTALSNALQKEGLYEMFEMFAHKFSEMEYKVAKMDEMQQKLDSMSKYLESMDQKSEIEAKLEKALEEENQIRLRVEAKLEQVQNEQNQKLQEQIDSMNRSIENIDQQSEREAKLEAELEKERQIRLRTEDKLDQVYTEQSQNQKKEKGFWQRLFSSSSD
ncbi:MerR family transcriptional regulator [Pontibacillus yanchengensis]|uniref:MerR family transcriptional regulator n=1 Tax=Pontibacillus yanchengensis TaxID=462910 RepID=UPI00136AD028